MLSSLFVNFHRVLANSSAAALPTYDGKFTNSEDNTATYAKIVKITLQPMLFYPNRTISFKIGRLIKLLSLFLIKQADSIFPFSFSFAIMQSFSRLYTGAKKRKASSRLFIYLHIYKGTLMYYLEKFLRDFVDFIE